jgi:hypothetical protein
LQFAESALGALDGFKTPIVINAAAAILSIVNMCFPSCYPKLAVGFATAVGVIGFWCH